MEKEENCSATSRSVSSATYRKQDLSDVPYMCICIVTARFRVKDRNVDSRAVNNTLTSTWGHKCSCARHSHWIK